MPEPDHSAILEKVQQTLRDYQQSRQSEIDMWGRQNYGFDQLSCELAQSKQLMQQILSDDLVVPEGEAQKHIHSQRLQIKKIYELMAREKARKKELERRRQAFNEVTT